MQYEKLSFAENLIILVQLTTATGVLEKRDSHQEIMNERVDEGLVTAEQHWKEGECTSAQTAALVYAMEFDSSHQKL